jgi:EAL domain-containing protein (putative c-di-GMP-specific phosphodiesterase class I)
MSTGTIEQAEALVRWQHPQRGLIYPNEFIPFAEQTGRIHDITLWAIEEALMLIQSVSEIGETRISVNVSALDLQQPEFALKVIELLRASKVEPNLLCLEITESNAMEDPDRVLETLIQLHDHRIYLAIDDFGSGYSSLAYMKRFPVDELKIDRTLVAGARRNTDSETILRCTIELGHHMGMLVTAEGVETIEEYGVLQHLAVDHIQGFLVSKAIPLEQYKQFCQAFNQRQLQNDNARLSMTPINPTVVVSQ